MMYFGLLAIAVTTIQAPSSSVLRGWASELLTRCEARFRSKAHPDLFDEKWSEAGSSGQLAFNWSVGMTIFAKVSDAKIHPERRDEMLRYVRATYRYWNETGPVPGFDVLPGPKTVDRYYDDNAWMAMGLVEAYQLTRQPDLLSRAEKTVKYVFSGEDPKLGGGIYWKEAEKTSKNTCSNGPAAAAALALNSVAPRQALTDSARRIYSWTKAKLTDPSDHLMWDNVNLKDEIERTKWSYNTALMLRTARELKLTSDANAFRDASKSKWLPDGSHGIPDEGKFAALLVDQLSSDYPKEIAVRLAWVWHHGVGKQGLLGPRWDREADPSRKQFELIDQVAFVRALYRTAESLEKS